MDPDEKSKSRGDELPFGAMEDDGAVGTAPGLSLNGSPPSDMRGRRKVYRRPENRRGGARRGGRRRGRRAEGDAVEARPAAVPAENGAGPGVAGADRAGAAELEAPRAEEGRSATESPRPETAERRGRGRRGRRGRRILGPDERRERSGAAGGELVSGLLMLERKKGPAAGTLRREDNGWIPTKGDVLVPQRTIQQFKLREGAMVTGRVSSRKGGKPTLVEVREVDGQAPKHWASTVAFKNLTSIDPDFHYALGDETGELSLKILDIICPVGRGTRGLIVAPPRSGKTILMQQFAKGIEKVYPDVHLMVLLVDERPEEATEWKRTTAGQVFVSTNDEPAERHVKLAEVVWRRCQRLVEIGEDVVLMLDSITRLARAYNNTIGAGSGRTMSGGLDSRTMERPKQFFGSARNTETAGSLTILGTTLVETGSRMDQVIFEEFKGTGNMELVLARKLADRRVFPAIDIERSGTRKEEKLISSHRLRQIHTLRRVLARMHYLEAMELLITKLDEYESTGDFLKRFEVDPDA